MEPLKALVQHWAAQHVTHRSGATPEAVRSFEQMHGIVVPADFREYLLRLDGLAEYGQGADANGFAFWPLRRIRPVANEELPEGLRGEGYFVFADYLDWSWGYAIQLLNQHGHGKIVHVGTLHAKVVAPSFTSFVELYVADAPQIYPDAPPK